MKVALVYDRVNKWGGAERVLLALHRLWPDAPLYTAVYDAKRAAWADVFSVRTSFLQHIPFAKRSHESLALFTPMAFETFSFDGMDVVISVTSADAKNVITKPGTVHICYCLTPTRYLWSGYLQYQKNPGLGLWNSVASFGLRTFGPMLKRWDLVASKRPDYYIAISNRVKTRIETYYDQPVYAVVPPPVDTRRFKPQRAMQRSAYQDLGKGESGRTKRKGNYFLTVSRLVSYKRVDILIHAFNRLKLPLVIIGDGHQKKELMSIAGETITFVDHHLTESELVRYYEGCRAFVFAADEDFGLVAAEAQACGIPVIAYRNSGVSEIVADGVSGLLFDRQTPEAIIKTVRAFGRMRFSASDCRAQVTHMSESKFSDTMKHIVTELVKKEHI